MFQHFTIKNSLAVALTLLILATNFQAAPGSFILPTHTDFRGSTYTSNNYLTATYYFYWYDDGLLFARTQDPFFYPDYHLSISGVIDNLTEHPDYSIPSVLGSGGYPARPKALYPTPPNFSMLDPQWHAREAEQIARNYVHIMAADYWGGAPLRYPKEEIWSNQGLDALNVGLDTLRTQTRPYPRVAMFFDTNTLTTQPGNRAAGLDLTTPTGKEELYGAIRDFYSRLHPRYWARINSRPIVWFYRSQHTSRMDSGVFEYLNRRFSQDFGGLKLYFIGDTGWQTAANSRAPLDRTYSWGAARQADGVITERDVVSVGPGFHSWTTGGFRNREGGNLYIRAWESALATNKRLIAVETWNEWFEGTAVAPSYEYATRYSGLTRRYASLHRNR